MGRVEQNFYFPVFVALNYATNVVFRVKVKILYLEDVQMMIFPQKCGILNETPVRERLKEEITTLTDRQAEYVLRRLQDVQDKKAVKG
jgi:hypothetical protein